MQRGDEDEDEEKWSVTCLRTQTSFKLDVVTDNKPTASLDGSFVVAQNAYTNDNSIMIWNRHTNSTQHVPKPTRRTLLWSTNLCQFVFHPDNHTLFARCNGQMFQMDLRSVGSGWTLMGDRDICNPRYGLSRDGRWFVSVTKLDFQIEFTSVDDVTQVVTCPHIFMCSPRLVATSVSGKFLAVLHRKERLNPFILNVYAWGSFDLVWETSFHLNRQQRITQLVFSEDDNELLIVYSKLKVCHMNMRTGRFSTTKPPGQVVALEQVHV